MLTFLRTVFIFLNERERKVEEMQTDSKVPFFISSDLWWKSRQIYSVCTFTGNSLSIKNETKKNTGFNFIGMHKINEVASARVFFSFNKGTVSGCESKDEPQCNNMRHIETLGRNK